MPRGIFEVIIKDLDMVGCFPVHWYSSSSFASKNASYIFRFALVELSRT